MSNIHTFSYSNINIFILHSIMLAQEDKYNKKKTKKKMNAIDWEYFKYINMT